MTARQIIINCLDADTDYTCRKTTCGLPEKEGNTGECCHKCALDILNEYKTEIYNKAINDFMKELYHRAFETDTDMQKWDSGCWIRYKMAELVAEQLKEQNNDC